MEFELWRGKQLSTDQVVQEGKSQEAYIKRGLRRASCLYGTDMYKNVFISKFRAGCRKTSVKVFMLLVVWLKHVLAN